jgi:hypothetical protein
MEQLDAADRPHRSLYLALALVLVFYMVVCAPVVDLPQPSRGGFLAKESETLD